MAADGSKSVVLLALGASLTSAAATLWAAASTGSAALSAIGFLFLAASGSQALMVAGLTRTARTTAASSSNNDLYVWSFVAALILFSLAAGVALHEGIGKIMDAPRILLRSQNAVAALALAFALNVAVFAGVLARTKLIAQRESQSPLHAGDAFLATTRIETIAALAGLLIGGLGVSLSYAWDSRFADGGAAIFVGLIIASVAALMAIEIRRLLVGKSHAANTSIAPVDASFNNVLKESSDGEPALAVEEPAREREAVREKPATLALPAAKRSTEPHLSRRAKKRLEQQHRRHPQGSDS